MTHFVSDSLLPVLDIFAGDRGVWWLRTPPAEFVTKPTLNTQTLSVLLLVDHGRALCGIDHTGASGERAPLEC